MSKGIVDPDPDPTLGENSTRIRLFIKKRSGFKFFFQNPGPDPTMIPGSKSGVIYIHIKCNYNRY